MSHKIYILLLVVGIAAMGTFGFGLMGHAAQHMCPAIEFLGYECPMQAASGADSSVHHLSTFQALSKVTAHSGAYILLALIFLALIVTVAVGSILDLVAYLYFARRINIKEREESVFISRQQFFRWFALLTNRDSYAF